MATRSPESARRTPAGVVAPGLLEFGLVGAAMVVALIGSSIGVRVPIWMNYAAPLLLAAGLAAGVITLVRRDVTGMWTPLLWFRLAMIAYSGIGSMVPLFANDATLRQINAFFDLYPGDMIRYNLVTCLFTFVLLGFARGACALADGAIRRREAGFAPAALSQGRFGMLCLAVGVTAEALIFWPPVLLGRGVNVPTLVSSLALLTLIGYALLAAWCLANRRYGRFVLLALLVAFDFVIGVVGFNKSQALLPLVFFALGVLYDRPTLLRAAILSGAIVFIYATITPMVTYGRQVLDLSRLNTGIALSERLEVLRTFDRQAGAETREQAQGSWARLTYISEGSFAMSQYDRGLPGDTLQDVVAVLIPRFLYPGKPEITRFGIEFNVLKSGNDLSQSLPGIPAEGYWDLGFPGVVLFASLMGAAYGLWSIYAVAAVRSRAWHLFFVAILGIRAAARIDGLFVADFEGSVALAIAAHYALTFLNGLAVPRATRAPAAAAA